MTSDQPLNQSCLSDYLVDPDRNVCLCCDGLVGYSAAVALDAEGTEHLVLIEDAAVDDEHVRYDAACTTVIHEQIGPLPTRWQARVRYAPIRCGRPTKAGYPCRVEVARPGSTCGWHRGTRSQARQ